MVTALDLRNLLDRFDRTLRETMQVSSVAVYLTGPLNGKYPLTHPLKENSDIFTILREDQKQGDGAAAGSQEGATAVAAHQSGIIPLWKSGDALVAAAYHAKDVLVLGEMEMMARDNVRIQEAAAQMREANAEICLPLKRDGKMIGIALLGPREGDRYYSPEDLDLLHLLGQSACVAIQNALLVEEIKLSYQILHRTQRFAAMGNLIAGLSHEIRNPLMPISYMLELIDDPSVEKERLMRQRKTSWEAMHRITGVLDEMEELSRPYRPAFAAGDINQLADDALMLLDMQIKLRKQEVIREYTTLPPFMVDAERLKQALADVLLNALEATPENGKIFVRTRGVGLKGTQTNPDQPGIQVEITDTGCGIPPENIERVFDPFFTTKYKSIMREGTGLGLSIAHRIVEEHRGSIELLSEVGKGTTVFINLPVNARREGTDELIYSAAVRR